MSSCKVQVSTGEWKDGQVGYFDPKSNRYFVECDDQYFWTPMASVKIDSDLKTIPGFVLLMCSIMDRVNQKSSHDTVQMVSNLDRNEKLNPDSLLTMLQRLECNLLNGDVRSDMRRIEFEYMIRRDHIKRKRQDCLVQLAVKKIPRSDKYHEYPEYKKPAKSSSSSRSELTHRQELLQWAYNHGNTWSKTYLNSRNTKVVPENLHIKLDYLRQHEDDLCTK